MFELETIITWFLIKMFWKLHYSEENMCSNLICCLASDTILNHNRICVIKPLHLFNVWFETSTSRIVIALIHCSIKPCVCSSLTNRNQLLWLTIFTVTKSILYDNSVSLISLKGQFIALQCSLIAEISCLKSRKSSLKTHQLPVSSVLRFLSTAHADHVICFGDLTATIRRDRMFFFEMDL